MRNLVLGVLAGAVLCLATVAENTNPPSPDPGAALALAASAAPQTSPAPTSAPTQASQTSPPATTSQASATSMAQHKIAPGTVIPVELTKTIDAKKAKTGDEVVAKVAVDMKTQNGDVMVPKDTKVFGHVTEAQARSKDLKESQLAIAFDRAVTKDGNSMQLPMSIQAIIGPQNNQNAGDADDSPSPTSSNAPQGGGAARSPMGGSTTPPQRPPSAGTGIPSTDTEGGNRARPPINTQTQGVIGISNLTLSPNSNATQGSLVTSEKNNVKLESGTMLLLRVNQ